jgi:hypothetical protein
MASYHLSVKTHSRSQNANAVALASYRSGERLWDEQQQLPKDCRNSNKSGVLYTELINNNNMNREQLWNTAEKCERRKNSVVAREVEIALPCELSQGEQINLSREYSKFLAERYNVSVDLAVHAPDGEGDDRNFHAHILMTTREVEGTGLGKKNRDLDQPKGRGRLEIETVRSVFADMQNKYLSKNGIADRVSAKKSIEQDQPKKYQVLPFKKYQVMRREESLEEYQEASGAVEQETFLLRKEQLEIDDLIGKIGREYDRNIEERAEGRDFRGIEEGAPSRGIDSPGGKDSRRSGRTGQRVFEKLFGDLRRNREENLHRYQHFERELQPDAEQSKGNFRESGEARESVEYFAEDSDGAGRRFRERGKFNRSLKDIFRIINEDFKHTYRRLEQTIRRTFSLSISGVAEDAIKGKGLRDRLKTFEFKSVDISLTPLDSDDIRLLAEKRQAIKINIDLEGLTDGINGYQQERRGRVIEGTERGVRQETDYAEGIDGRYPQGFGEEECRSDATYQRFKHDFEQADRRNRDALKEPDQDFEQSIILSSQRASEELRQQRVRDLRRRESFEERLRYATEQSEGLKREFECTRRGIEQTQKDFTGGREHGVRQRIRDGVRRLRGIEGLRYSLGRIHEGIKETYSRFARSLREANGQLDSLGYSGAFKDTVKRVIGSIKAVFSHIDKESLEEAFEPLDGKTIISGVVDFKMPSEGIRKDVKLDFSSEDLELTKDPRTIRELRWKAEEERAERQQQEENSKSRGRGIGR